MPASFAGETSSSLNLGAAPWLPPVTSDVVIDLSHWQTSVDFVKAKAAGIVAVILKATQGSRWIDATFTQRFAAATGAGLLVGAYHFLDASPPELQMANFLAVADGSPVLALDAEPNAIGATVTVRRLLKLRHGCKWLLAMHRSFILAAMGPTNVAQVFRTVFWRDVRCGCLHTTRDQFVRWVGLTGRCGSTPTGASAPTCCLCLG